MLSGLFMILKRKIIKVYCTLLVSKPWIFSASAPMNDFTMRPYSSVSPEPMSFPSLHPADVAGAKFSAKKFQQSSSVNSGWEVSGDTPASLDS